MSLQLKRFFVFAMVVAGAFGPAAAAPQGTSGASNRFVVVFHQSSLPANIESVVAAAGGVITQRVPEIGGIGVVSSNPGFIAAMKANNSVRAADVATRMSLDPVWDQTHDLTASSSSSGTNGGNISMAGSDPQAMPDSLGSQQWDKMRMNATITGSYAVQTGRHDVKVAVLDTGADVTHIDVAPNLNLADSVSFVPTEPTIQDFNGHGTWTISAVGAPVNGVGISGVAPTVTLVALKVLDGGGSGDFLWLDQALVYAGLKHFDVASMSLGGYIPKCGSETNPGGCDHADFILLQRAVQFARSNGVLSVAALGNDGFDVSDGSFFRNYIEAPGEVAGVVGVSATGYYNQKAFYSSYGVGKTDISAPGGSTRDYSGVPGSGAPPPPYLSLGRLIGAWSSTASEAPSDPVTICTGPGATPPCFLYGFVQGTSMATPNVSGVAALIISQNGDFSGKNKNKPHMNPTQVESILQITANNQPCPNPRTVTQGPGLVFEFAVCNGGAGDNNFFGKGIADALRAVTFH